MRGPSQDTQAALEEPQRSSAPLGPTVVHGLIHTPERSDMRDTPERSDMRGPPQGTQAAPAEPQRTAAPSPTTDTVVQASRHVGQLASGLAPAKPAAKTPLDIAAEVGRCIAQAERRTRKPTANNKTNGKAKPNMRLRENCKRGFDPQQGSEQQWNPRNRKCGFDPRRS